MGDLLFVLPALFNCFVLIGIHTYFGIHVMKRGIVFVDLAMAQIAALGGAFGMLVGFEMEHNLNRAMALGFTILGAGLLSFAPKISFKTKLPKEAFIGVLYVFAAACMLLAVGRVDHGIERIKFFLNGSILWSTWTDVFLNAAIYLLVGFGLFLMARRTNFISKKEADRIALGRADRVTNFVFYFLFGVVVNQSVKTAGVFLVFTLLVAPTMFSALWATSLRSRLGAGWLFGVACSTFGLAISYWLDVPAGPLLVVVFVVALALASLLKRFGRL